MNSHFNFIWLFIASMFLFGCSTAQFQRESAGAIGGDVNPDQVTISDVDQGMTSWKWNANTTSGMYNCSTSLFDNKTLCFKAKSSQATPVVQALPVVKPEPLPKEPLVALPTEEKNAPIVAPQTKANIPSKMIVAASKEKIRKKPSNSATVVKSLKKGEVVQVIKQQDDWSQVELVSGDVGWCRNSALTSSASN